MFLTTHTSYEKFTTKAENIMGGTEGDFEFNSYLSIDKTNMFY